MATYKSWAGKALKNFVLFLGGVALVTVLTRPAVAQQAAVLFGVNSGALKALSVSSDGYINIALPNGLLDFGSAGVRVSGDGDGAITFLGLGNGSDEDLTLNLDDTANTVVVSSSTGVTRLQLTGINLMLPDGSAADPSFAFLNDPDTGFYWGGGGTLVTTLDGVPTFQWQSVGLDFRSDGSLSWYNGVLGTTRDISLLRDGEGILAQRRGTNPQIYRPYGYYASGTSFVTGVIATANEAVTVSGASTATTNIIPAGSFVLGVATTTTTVITGASGYTVGDGTDADRWGDITGTAVGTDSDNTNSTANPTGYFAAASAVTLTAKTSNFTGGVVQVTVFYLTTFAD